MGAFEAFTYPLCRNHQFVFTFPGVYSGCDEARKASKTHAVLSLSADPLPFDANTFQALVIEGIPAGLKCPEHVGKKKSDVLCLVISFFN